MKMTFKQTIIKSEFDEENIEEHIKSELVPNVNDYVIVGNIYGRVYDKIIDYNNCNDIVIKIRSREMFEEEI